MQDLLAKKEALIKLKEALAELQLDNMKSPDPSPEHEAKETPEEESLEHETGMEAQDENIEGDDGIAVKKEETIISDDPRKLIKEEENKRSPFRSDKERLLANMYKGLRG